MFVGSRRSSDRFVSFLDIFAPRNAIDYIKENVREGVLFSRKKISSFQITWSFRTFSVSRLRLIFPDKLLKKVYLETEKYRLSSSAALLRLRVCCKWRCIASIVLFYTTAFVPFAQPKDFSSRKWSKNDLLLELVMPYNGGLDGWNYCTVIVGSALVTWSTFFIAH